MPHPARENVSMTNYYDKLETRQQESRERWQLERLPRQIAHAKARAPAFSRILEKIDPAAIKTRAALRDIPITRKSDLLSLQNASRPFGGFAAAHGPTLDGAQQFAERPAAELAEQLVLVSHERQVPDLEVACRKVVVPPERQPLGQRVGPEHHPVDPPCLESCGIARDGRRLARPAAGQI